MWTVQFFGIPQDQWDPLNQHQRSQVIDGYNLRTQAEAQLAPIYAISNALKLPSTKIDFTTPSLDDNFFKADQSSLKDKDILKIGEPLPFPNR